MTTDNFFCILSHLSLIEVTGDKAAGFLQGQLTCDVREVGERSTRMGAYCSAKGRVLASLRVMEYEKRWLLSLPLTLRQLTLQALQKVAMLSRVQLLTNDDLVGIGCYGADIARDLEAIFGEIPKNIDEAVYKNGALCIRLRGDQPRFEIYTQPETLTALLSTYPQRETTLWRLLDIHAGVANIYPETRDLFTPHMLNYPALNAVSFNKGCYVGQEVVARTHYLGKTKRNLEHLTLERGQPVRYFKKADESSALQPGDKILNAAQEEIGVVIDAIEDATGNNQILAVTSSGAH